MSQPAYPIDFVEFPGRDAATVAAAKAFYTDVFGWAFRDWGEDYVDTLSSGLSCGFNADPAHAPQQPLVVIHSANLEASHAQVIAAGGRISKEIFSFPGGRRFHFVDPAGNELAIWSDLDHEQLQA